MTLSEFREISTWDELLDFASDCNYYELTEDYYTRDSFLDKIYDDARYHLDDYGWESCRDYLNSIPEDRYDVYYYNSNWGEWAGYDDGDDEFCDFKETLEYKLIEDELLDKEEEDEPEEEEVEPEPIDDVEEFEDEELSFESFSEECASEFRAEVVNRKPTETEEDIVSFFF